MPGLKELGTAVLKKIQLVISILFADDNPLSEDFVLVTLKSSDNRLSAHLKSIDCASFLD